MTLEDLIRNPLSWGTVLLAVGIWLMLPRGTQRGRWMGLAISLAAFGLIASRMPVIGDCASTATFGLLATVTVVSALFTVTMRSPVYCAIWFALSLLGTAGLFMLQGAQFLGVATVVVYAGAILVTFLFVLMLASSEGYAFYDRLSWEAPLSAITGSLMIGILSFALVGVFNPSDSKYAQIPAVNAVREVEILAREHTAHLGGWLFSTHLVSIELAGTLLLIALVGCIAIVSESKISKDRKSRRAGW